MPILVILVRGSPRTLNWLVIIYQTDYNWCFQPLCSPNIAWWCLWCDRGQTNRRVVSSYGCLLVSVGSSGPQLEYFGSVWSFLSFMFTDAADSCYSKHIPFMLPAQHQHVRDNVAVYCLKQWNIQQQEPNISHRSPWNPNIFSKGPSEWMPGLVLSSVSVCKSSVILRRLLRSLKRTLCGSPGIKLGSTGAAGRRYLLMLRLLFGNHLWVLASVTLFVLFFPGSLHGLKQPQALSNTQTGSSSTKIQNSPVA